MKTETQYGPTTTDTGRSIAVITASILLGLVRVCLALVFFVGFIGGFVLAIASGVAGSFDVQALSPIVSWMSSDTGNPHPLVYGIVYAIITGACGALAEMVTGQSACGHMESLGNKPKPNEIVVDGVRYREVKL